MVYPVPVADPDARVGAFELEPVNIFILYSFFRVFDHPMEASEPILVPVNEIAVRFLDRYRDLTVAKLAAVPVDSVDRAKAPPIGV